MTQLYHYWEYVQKTRYPTPQILRISYNKLFYKSLFLHIVFITISYQNSLIFWS